MKSKHHVPKDTGKNIYQETERINDVLSELKKITDVLQKLLVAVGQVRERVN